MDENRVKEIFEKLYAGAYLKDALTQSERQPFFKFINSKPEWTDAYDRAQQVRAEIVVDEIIDIADTEQDAQVARNRIDARKWYASKMRPSKYGDRIDVNVSGTIDISAQLAAAESRVALVQTVASEVVQTIEHKKDPILPLEDEAVSESIPLSEQE